MFEFHKLIPLLTERFTIVAPSLPGYTLSFKPGQKRFGVEEIAEVFAALMTDVLGYRRFGVQGGDWGVSSPRSWDTVMPNASWASTSICWPSAAIRQC